MKAQDPYRTDIQRTGYGKKTPGRRNVEVDRENTAAEGEAQMKPKPKQGSARDLTFAEGGSRQKMFKEQAANPATSGRTGKVQSPAPGAKAAKGGSRTSSAPSLAVPAKAGHTSSVRKGR